MKFKRIAAVISAAAVVLALTGCGNEANLGDPLTNNPQNGQSVSANSKPAGNNPVDMLLDKIRSADTAAKERITTVNSWIAENVVTGGDEKYACDLKISMNNGTATISESKTTIPGVSDSDKENDWEARIGCDSLKERFESDYPGQTFTATVFVDDSGYALYSWFVPDIAD